jgi:hypothetical protein
MRPELHGGGSWLGEGVYDASSVYAAAAAAGSQLLAPRERPEAELGHPYQSPWRLRSLALQAGPFGRALRPARTARERQFGQATSFGGGPSPLPAWARGLARVPRWVWAKLLINGVRIMKNHNLRPT